MARWLLAVSTASMLFAQPQNIPADYREQFLQLALTYLGVPFVHGGHSRYGIDSLRLVQTCFSRVMGRFIPDDVRFLGTARDLNSLDRAQPGDLVFFEVGGVPAEIGIFLDRDRVILSSPENLQGTEIVSLSQPGLKGRIVGVLDPFQTDFSGEVSEPRAYLGVEVGPSLQMYQRPSLAKSGVAPAFIVIPTVDGEVEILFFRGTYPYPMRILYRMRQTLVHGKSTVLETGRLEEAGTYGLVIRDEMGRVLTRLHIEVHDLP